MRVEMAKHVVSLDDKFDLSEDRQILTGTQAIVRLLLMQKKRDAEAGLNTGGFVSGYRGSPIASLEGALLRSMKLINENDIFFQPGLNEDLAATAIWGTQQAELRGEGKFDGVFGMWYGKGPGVDRTGDVFRHANHAGTSRFGGVLALMGDDHTCESSTTAHQSEFAFLDAMMPILNPAGVQEILDYGLLGYGLSRYAGVWVGLKCVKDNIESTATVDGRIDRVRIAIPTEDVFAMPEGGLNIRLGEEAITKEARLFDYKRDAVLAFARANKIDKTVFSGGPKARIGIVTAGKSYLDVRAALDSLGIDEVAANQLGLRLYKVGMSWPLEPEGIAKFAEGLDLIVVIEEKRSLIESQIKEELFDRGKRPRVVGKKDENNDWLFPAKGALDPVEVGIAIGERLLQFNPEEEEIKARLAGLKQLRGNKPVTPEAFVRTPYFCAGCPHSTSTRVPEGSHAYAGIGCHYMAQWMDRSTEGFTHMGGEGANWIGEAPFSKRKHVFQNIGDGTYVHSGSLAIRASVAAGVNVTYKVLYNDAVAMTGGQAIDGGLTAPQIAAQLLAEGVKRVDIVTDEPEKYGPDAGIPAAVSVHHRRDLMVIQKELSEIEGVTALVYDQTCASEKRRRRKRGLFPDPDKRVFINEAVCEGCGDCGTASNCVAILPNETEFGRKRKIDQSACNKDFSCVEGFCPSFVTLHGAKPKKAEGAAKGHGGLTEMLGALPEPDRPNLEDEPYAVIVTGVGGTGVVTISAILGQAAYIEEKGFGSIDMTGLAQKGGAVACHLRFARSSDEINAIRVGVGAANLIIGGDLVVTASNKVLETVKPDRTAVVVNTYEMITGDFTRNPDLAVPGGALLQSIADRVRGGELDTLDAHDYAVKLFGDSIASNMFLLGFAYQKGHLPVGAEAIEKAVELNGAAVEMNRQAFRLGRLAAHDRSALDRIAKPKADKQESKELTLDDLVARRVSYLTDYQDASLAARYRAKVDWIADLEKEKSPGRSGLAMTVAKAYHKVLSYKDEYEVARLYTDGRFEAAVAENFDGVRKFEYHLAPPVLSWFRRDPTTGHPRKMRFGSWMRPVFRIIRKGKALRGTAWDVFGYSQERRRERELIKDYEALLDRIGGKLTPESHAVATALAGIPLEIKGFGHVKDANQRRAMKRWKELLDELESPAPARVAAE
jgi:indolepyruvate ferredoxin oxidoreductase